MASTQTDCFPTEIRLWLIEPNRNVWKFYNVTVERTLFDEWAVIRSWGRIGTTGSRRRNLVDGPGEALDMIGKISEAKTKQGYKIVWSR